MNRKSGGSRTRRQLSRASFNFIRSFSGMGICCTRTSDDRLSIEFKDKLRVYQIVCHYCKLTVSGERDFSFRLSRESRILNNISTFSSIRSTTIKHLLSLPPKCHLNAIFHSLHNLKSASEVKEHAPHVGSARSSATGQNLVLHAQVTDMTVCTQNLHPAGHAHQMMLLHQAKQYTVMNPSEPASW